MVNPSSMRGIVKGPGKGISSAPAIISAPPTVANTTRLVWRTTAVRGISWVRSPGIC